MFWFMKKQLVGIDIGSRSIKLVQLKETKSGYELVKIGMAPLPAQAIVDTTLMDIPAIAEAVRGLIKKLDVKVKQAACSISGNSVIIRQIGFPLMTSDELEEQIQWEAEQYIPFDINDVNIDFHILGPNETDPKQMNVILAASKKDIISDYLSLFNQAGIALTVLDVDVFALQNVFEANYEPSTDDVIALADIGDTTINLTIIKNGGSLFTRDIQLGGNLYTQEIRKNLAVTFDEAENLKLAWNGDGDEAVGGVILQCNETVVMELYRTMNYYAANAGVDKVTGVFVSGGCCQTPFLLDALRTRLELPVELIDPFRKINCPDKQFDPGYLSQMGPHVSVAVGLAMRRQGDK
jgi:type IV pilus assembly protein PilM